jgi:hypothetical protein
MIPMIKVIGEMQSEDALIVMKFGLRLKDVMVQQYVVIEQAHRMIVVDILIQSTTKIMKNFGQSAIKF